MSRTLLSIRSPSLSLFSAAGRRSGKPARSPRRLAKFALYAIGPCVGAVYLLTTHSTFLEQNETSKWTHLNLPTQPTISIVTRERVKPVTTETDRSVSTHRAAPDRVQHHAVTTSQGSNSIAAPTAHKPQAASAEAIPTVQDVQTTVEIEKHLIPLSNAELAGQSWQEGLQKLAAGDNDGAVERFRHALALQPEHIEARWSLAATLINLAHTDAAATLLAEGLELTHHAPRLAGLYAHLLLSQGHPDEAVNILDTAPPPVKEDPEYHALLASILVRTGQHERAAGIYASLLTVDASNGVWWLGLGVCAEALAKPGDAVTAYERATMAGLGPEMNDIVHGRLAALKTQANMLAQTEEHRP